MGKTYCSRCEKQLPSQHALQQHYNDHGSHNRCDTCTFDGTTWGKLLDHYRKTKHRAVCEGCNGGNGRPWVAGSQEYLDHLDEENVCETCKEHFQSPSNLHHHEMVHLEPSIECYGCHRKFTTYPAMILHLEAGTCSPDINRFDLNESAAMCYQWKAYIDENYRDALLNRDDLQSEYSEVVYPFRCPECNEGFTKLSGLFQHVYSNKCDQGLDEGKIAKLIRWLENRHELDEAE